MYIIVYIYTYIPICLDIENDDDVTLFIIYMHVCTN